MNELRECCIIVLNLLKKLLDEGKITIDEYKRQSMLKIKFLNDTKYADD